MDQRVAQKMLRRLRVKQIIIASLFPNRYQDGNEFMCVVFEKFNSFGLNTIQSPIFMCPSLDMVPWRALLTCNAQILYVDLRVPTMSVRLSQFYEMYFLQLILESLRNKLPSTLVRMIERFAENPHCRMARIAITV